MLKKLASSCMIVFVSYFVFFYHVYCYREKRFLILVLTISSCSIDIYFREREVRHICGLRNSNMQICFTEALSSNERLGSSND